MFVLLNKLARVEEEIALLNREIKAVERHFDARIRSYDERWEVVNEIMASWYDWDKRGVTVFVRGPPLPQPTTHAAPCPSCWESLEATEKQSMRPSRLHIAVAFVHG